MVRGSLKHRLLTISGLELRARWLEAELPSFPPALSARVLNELAEECEAARSDAREAMLAVALCVVRLGCAAPNPYGGEDLLSQLRTEAQASRLLSVERVLRRGPTESEQDRVLRVPDYGTGRELSLGERRSLARRPDRRNFERLLSDPSPMVASILLKNPRLTQDDVLRVTARRPAPGAVLREIVCSPRWIARSRIRQSVLLNPGSPDEISMPLVPLCSRGELHELVASGHLPLLRRATALELLERRPPLVEPLDRPLH